MSASPSPESATEHATKHAAEHATEHSPKTKANKPQKDNFWRFTVLLIIIFGGIRLFIAEPFLVYGSSMEPNFETGDYLIVDSLTYRFEDPKRGDVIVLRPPIKGQETTHYIKRILGLPNETIIVDGAKVTIKNAAHPEGFIVNEPYITFQSDRKSEVTLGPTQYYVMGDNRAVSSDSRIWGPLDKSEISGRAIFRAYPFNQPHIFPGSIDKFTEETEPLFK